MSKGAGMVRASWALVALITACGSPSAAATPPEPLQAVPMARVSLLSFMVGPSKPDGMVWDGPGGAISADDAAALTRALQAGTPAVVAASVFARPTIQALEKPEVQGRAALFIRAAQIGSWQAFTGQRDAFNPQLMPPPTWFHVPLDGTARIAVEAIDKDLSEDDPMGSFFIDPNAIQAAADSPSSVYQSNVAYQTQRAVLFVEVNAIRE